MITYREIISKYKISQHKFYNATRGVDVGRIRAGHGILYDEKKIDDLLLRPKKEAKKARRLHDCLKYRECLTEAALKNSEMHCHECRNYCQGVMMDGEI